MTTPLFTLVVLTRDRRESLVRCLESICRQTMPRSEFEVLVIDDGSGVPASDVALRFAAGLEIRYDYRPSEGVGAAKNRGVRLARGKYVALVADDYWLPKDYLDKAKEFFVTHPNAGALTFNMRSRGGGLFTGVQTLYFQLTLWQTLGPIEPDGFAVGNDLPASRAAVFRRSIFEEVGEFQQGWHSGEDYDFSLRLQQWGYSVYFCTQVTIDHFDGAGLLFYLRQRLRYSRNLLSIGQRNGIGSPKALSFYGFAKASFGQWLRWFSLARRFRATVRYLLLAPFLLLFLTTYWWGVYRSAVRSLSG